LIELEVWRSHHPEESSTKESVLHELGFALARPPPSLTVSMMHSPLATYAVRFLNTRASNKAHNNVSRSSSRQESCSLKAMLLLLLLCACTLLIFILSARPTHDDPFKLADDKQPRANHALTQVISCRNNAATGAPTSRAHVDIKQHFEAAPNAKTSRFGVVTMHADWAKYEWANCSFARPKKDYCKRHNYAYFDESMYMEDEAIALREWMLVPNKRLRFRKLQYLEQLLRAKLQVEWFLWIDGDAIFQIPELTIDSRLEMVQARLSLTEPKAPPVDPVFVLSQDFNGINNGVWFIRNSPEAHCILLNIFNTYANPDNRLADQLSLINYLIMHQRFLRDRVWLLREPDMHVLQEYPSNFLRSVRWIGDVMRGGNDDNDDDEHGSWASWIIHLPGRKMWKRQKILEARGLLCGSQGPRNRVWLEQIAG
jgi:hypothetical protein